MLEQTTGEPGRATGRELELARMLHGALLDAAGWAGVNQSLRDQRDEARKQRDEAEQKIQGLEEAIKSCQEHADAAWAERDNLNKELLKIAQFIWPGCEGLEPITAQNLIDEINDIITTNNLYIENLKSDIAHGFEPKCEHGVSSLCCSMHRSREDWLFSHIRAIGYGDLIATNTQAANAIVLLKKWRNIICYHSEGSEELHRFLIEIDQIFAQDNVEKSPNKE